MTDRAVVAHFYLAEFNQTAYDLGSADIVMRVCANAQNKDWATLTPSGEMKMRIKNPEAIDLFRTAGGPCLTEEYEVVITKLPAKPGRSGDHATSK